MFKTLILLLIIMGLAGCSYPTSSNKRIQLENKNEMNINKDDNCKSFARTVLERQSIRSFSSEPVDQEIIKNILLLVNRAPSAGNLQAYKIYLVKDRDTIKQLGDASLGQTSVSSSNQLLVFVALKEVSGKKYRERGRDLYCIQDATIAATYAQLAIQYYGLGSVWIGAFKPEDVSKVLKLNSNQLPVAIIPFGYPDEKVPMSNRKPLNEMVIEI